MAKNPLTMLIRQEVLSFLLAIRCIARIVCDIRTVCHRSWTDKQFKLFVAVPGTMVIAIVALIEIEPIVPGEGVPTFMIAVLSLTRNFYDFCAGGSKQCFVCLFQIPITNVFLHSSTFMC